MPATDRENDNMGTERLTGQTSWPSDAALPSLSLAVGRLKTLAAVAALGVGSMAAELPPTTLSNEVMPRNPETPLRISEHTDSLAAILYEHRWNFDYPCIYNLTPYWVPPFWVDFRLEGFRNPEISMNSPAYAIKENFGSLLPSQENYLQSLGINLIYIDPSVPAEEQACSLMDQMTSDTQYRCQDTAVIKPPAEALPVTFLNPYCYPNPFNPSTTLSFETTRPADVSVRVYNVIGQEVASERMGPLLPGLHQWHLNNMGNGSSGVLTVELSAGKDTTRLRVTRVK